ncbi:MAG: BMP family protein [Bacillota bacterium]|nr:BMP family protein [Bacillota bacterium]
MRAILGKSFLMLGLLMLFALLLFGCAPTPAVDEPTEPAVEEEETVTAADTIKFAAVMPGSIQDADYNTLGFLAVQDLGSEFGVSTSYSERVAVPDAGRVMSEYIDDGFNVIWVHGSQFNDTALDLGANNPDVIFIIEVDAQPAQTLPNFWYLDRNFYTGFYVLGAAAALTTESGHIGYIGGVELPFTRAELNAMQQAIDDLESSATIQYLYVGDFNDPLEARRSAESLIARGVDVIVSSVNLGNYGIFTAAQEAGQPVLVTTKYTDKSTHAPQNYLTTDLFNFSAPLIEIVDRIIGGEVGGYLKLEYGEGKPRATQFPLLNVSDEISAQVRQIFDQVASGEITVIQKMDAIEVR